MLTLPAGIAAHVDDDSYSACHLIELGGTVTHRWTDFVSDLTWNGHTWLHTMPFRPGQIVTDAEGVQDVTITFDEQLHQLQGYDATEGMSDRPMRIHEAWVDTSTNPPTVYANGVMEDIASGTTFGLDFDETADASSGVLSLGSSATMNHESGNEYNLSCVNGFGDPRCKVVAAQTTVTAALGATGSQTVTPVSMIGIVSGIALSVTNADGTGNEIVIVTAVTGTTFTAVFTTTKAAAWTVRGLCRKTYANCTAYSNTANFRGCRHALTPPATVQWGAGSYILNNR